jgi:hypothetical protein
MVWATFWEEKDGEEDEDRMRRNEDGPGITRDTAAQTEWVSKWESSDLSDEVEHKMFEADTVCMGAVRASEVYGASRELFTHLDALWRDNRQGKTLHYTCVVYASCIHVD